MKIFRLKNIMQWGREGTTIILYTINSVNKSLDISYINKKKRLFSLYIVSLVTEMQGHYYSGQPKEVYPEYQTVCSFVICPFLYQWLHTSQYCLSTPLEHGIYMRLQFYSLSAVSTVDHWWDSNTGDSFFFFSPGIVSCSSITT